MKTPTNCALSLGANCERCDVNDKCPMYEFIKKLNEPKTRIKFPGEDEDYYFEL